MTHDKTHHKNWAYWKYTFLALVVEADKSETCNSSIVSHVHRTCKEKEWKSLMNHTARSNLSATNFPSFFALADRAQHDSGI